MSSVSEQTSALANAPARSMGLWEIDNELQALMEEAQSEEETTGSVQPATIAALQVYFQAAVTKVDKIAGFLKLEKMLEPAYKEEKRRLEARWGAYRNGFDRCKTMLLDFLQARGETRIKGAFNTISRQANSQPKLEIHDLEAIPQEYRRMTLTITLSLWDRIMQANAKSPYFLLEVQELISGMTDASDEAFVDEAAVRNALQDGKDVAGAELKHGEHIRVR